MTPFSGPNMGKHQDLLDIGDGTFVANHLREFRISENVKYGANLAVDQDLIAHEAHTVAVIRIPCTMNGAERLDGNAVESMPSVYGFFTRLLPQAVGNDHIFFMPR